jgi:DNA-binding NarL/FixJ family response regulator/predicted RNA-binding protein
MPGPLQVIAVSFGPSADFEGRVLAEVDRLQGRGVLRLLDVLFVAKTEDGVVERLLIGDDEDFGALLARIVPFGGVDLVADGASGFDPTRAWALAASLAPGTGLAFLLVEHCWAQPFFDAIAATGGTLVGEGFLTQEAGLLVGAEIAAMEEAAQVIEVAQAAEAEAVLLALVAEAEAAEAVAASEVIRAAAAADAVRALISAGIVEEAAAHEAIEALSAAGIIVTDAGEAATEAVAEAASRIKAASITMEQARVLRYLPTQLSFAVIADKLGITRSAAKDRAERLYKKLDVHSRAEAVTRARNLGIID